jgi:hypothetical protein
MGIRSAVSLSHWLPGGNLDCSYRVGGVEWNVFMRIAVPPLAVPAGWLVW